MAVNVQELHDRKIEKYHIQDESRFEFVFIDAFNRVLSDLRARAFATVTDITNLDDNVSLSQGYYSACATGVDYYIESDHEYGTDDSRVLFARYADAVKNAQLNYHQDNETTAQLGAI
jgi:hypothetical protein